MIGVIESSPAQISQSPIFLKVGLSCYMALMMPIYPEGCENVRADIGGGLAGQLNIETVLQNMPKPGQKS